MIKILRQIFKPHLAVTLRTGSQFETQIVERPGIWMSAEDLKALSHDLVTVASKTLAGGALNYGVFSGDAERMKASIITCVRDRKTKQPVAFNALAVMEIADRKDPVDVLHLGLVMVDPNQQSQGLSWVLYGLTSILLFVRNQLRPIWISNVTQVPAVIGMVSETFSDVFPEPGRSKRSLQHLLLARSILRDHRHVFGVGEDAEFDDDRFVITNAYTGGSDDLKKSFDVAQKHRDPAYNEFCKRELDYERGDDFLQLGRLDIGAAVGYIRNSVPRRSLAGLGVTFAVLMLQRLFLPILYWFDSSRQFNSLRPRKEKS